MLTRLRERGFVTAILSNGTPGMLRDAVASAGIGGLLDAVLSVDEVATYKPDPRVYRLAVDRLGVAPGEVSFQSSNAWDAYGAAAFGMRVVWCNRRGQPRERLPAAHLALRRQVTFATCMLLALTMFVSDAAGLS